MCDAMKCCLVPDRSIMINAEGWVPSEVCGGVAGARPSEQARAQNLDELREILHHSELARKSGANPVHLRADHPQSAV